MSEKYLRIKDGQSATIIFTHEPLRTETHWLSGNPQECLGAACGYCEDGHSKNARYECDVQHVEDAFITKHYTFPQTLHRQMKAALYAVGVGAFSGARFRVLRAGSGLDTVWQCVYLPDAPSPIQALQSLSQVELAELLNQLAGYGGKVVDDEEIHF